MSSSKLTKLVKTYTNGELSFESYREQRRQIVDEFVQGTKPVDKSDALDKFISSTPETRTPPRKSKSILLAIAGAVLVITIAMVLVLPDLQNAIFGPQTSHEDQPEAPSKPQAQKLIDNFLQTDQWNEQNINQFILDWQILSAAQRQQAQNTAWFTAFKSAIQQRLDKQKRSTAKTDSLSEDLLTSLLATVDPGYFIRQPFFGGKSTGAIAQAQPGTGTQTAAPKKPETHIAETPIKKDKKPAAKKPSPAASSVEGKKLNALLDQFVQYFKSGNLNSLMQLFAPDATTNYHTSAEEIKASYLDLFQTTAQRDLSFSDFSWKPATGNLVEGTGKYLAQMNPKDTNIDQVFSADVTVVVNEASNPPLISGLFLTNQQFSTRLRPAVKAAIPEAQKLPPPDKEELREILRKFVTAYNRGDIDGLMALFSQEAHTNDRTDINGIRQDYDELFQTTASREIVLTNITWKFAENQAVATGQFEAKIQPRTGTEPITYQGTIRIGVRKYEGGVLITQLLHNTQ